MKIAVLLHGSGVYDGTEIQEAVLSLLAIEEMGHTYQCIAPDIQQFHVVNHLTGEPMSETRNVLVESARIARGNVIKLSETDVHSFDALVMPGGFGTAKNFTTWAVITNRYATYITFVNSNSNTTYYSLFLLHHLTSVIQLLTCIFHWHRVVVWSLVLCHHW